ncbi:Valine--tRNA ligase, chloroplastic/mitochondrial 2 [Gracilariopsis chorda]|uniref:valine--tRNA ligase n=1 Tax=Gracilariopsis chorda TaxID=448386 RepID=A0A2V3IVZ0_9FLOR|nr:Valine--tRNA ligase, chloroplastic/mitochondrial 2 [Gracilariopsis chorda]|eukprot:PXF46243.1 Valine--tRNA ligase, chloroplastic/mitochondrial 2 [Gracilariopsis chorda]
MDFEARGKLWDAMDKEGLLIKVEDHVNRVPRSQRGGEIVEPPVSTQWFVKMKSLAEKAIGRVRDGDIVIELQRFEKVYFNWLEYIRDGCVSRQLLWGHRIPVWYVEEHSGEYIVARSDEEAAQIASEKYNGEAVTLKQETDVLDTWFSSGLWPFSTMGWPNEDAEDLKTFFPGSIMETGYDILFFWVARMIMLSLWLTGEVPSHNVNLHGLVHDKHGRKMRKTVGNVIDLNDVISSYGTDALCYTLLTGNTPGQDITLSNERIESDRNFANKLWNSSRFIIGKLDKISDEEQHELATVAISDFGQTDEVEKQFVVTEEPAQANAEPEEDGDGRILESQPSQDAEHPAELVCGSGADCLILRKDVVNSQDAPAVTGQCTKCHCPLHDLCGGGEK